MIANTFYKTIIFEITRKCNLHCTFCGRGDPQNISITKEIIDKAMTELKGAYINQIGISGGEPTVEPEMLIYLIDSIISHKLLVKEVFMFTNGLIFDFNVANAFKRLIKYLKQIEPNIKDSKDFYEKEYELVNINGKCNAKVEITISDWRHGTDRRKLIVTKNLYDNAINDDDFVSAIQSEVNKELNVISLEGNALKNYRQLLPSSVDLKDIRIVDNNYSFITKGLNDIVSVEKSISISSNGNVFVGGIMSYKNADKKPICNILDCKGDLLSYIDTFCWENPIDFKARDFRAKSKAVEFCKSHNIKIENWSKNDDDMTTALSKCIDAYEKIARDLHKLLPSLDQATIQLTAICTIVVNFYESHIPQASINSFLKLCTQIKHNDIKNMTPEWCRGFILFQTQKDKKRREKKQ